VNICGVFIFSGHINESVCAYNMLGLLLERQQLYRTAVKAFEAAQKLLETAEDATLSDMVYSNYGRVLVQLQQYEEAICVYQQVKKPDFSTQCGLSVAYFKGEQYDTAHVGTRVSD
jgi:tetratricopeptide (TPR) repeat protein